MNLTGKQIVEQGIVTKVKNIKCIQQHGIDLELIQVQQIIGVGHVPVKGKTKLAERKEIHLQDIKALDSDEIVRAWYLLPGSYDITFEQGCEIPSNQRLEIIQRSSLLRNGAVLRSSLFDAGFVTNNIGTVIHIQEPIIIEYKARIAQAYTTISNEVENLYDGQWQNDKQRQESNVSPDELGS